VSPIGLILKFIDDLESGFTYHPLPPHYKRNSAERSRGLHFPRSVDCESRLFVPRSCLCAPRSPGISTESCINCPYPAVLVKITLNYGPKLSHIRFVLSIIYAALCVRALSKGQSGDITGRTRHRRLIVRPLSKVHACAGARGPAIQSPNER
jgi:hypothetical protein